MSNARIWNWRTIGWLSLCLICSGGMRAAAETNTLSAEVAGKISEAAVSNDTLRVYMQLHEQIRDTQLAIERIRHDSELMATRNAEALASRLEDIEKSVASQRDAMQSTMQSTGKFMLVVFSIFAGVGFVGIVLTAFFQWRTVSRLAEISASVPATRPFGLLPAGSGFNAGDSVVSSGPVEQASAGMVGVLERLEKRIVELEHSAHPPLGEPAGGNGDISEHPLPLTNGSAELVDPDKSAQIKMLLDKGQSLLNLNKTDEAVRCFDDVLALEPDNTEALVKKGTAFEKMRKLPEAIECYDRAIAVDGSMTIAYLYKGGLYNRMERFSEAVECYEQALRTQEKRAA
jgi:TolA-binding protein